MLEPIHVNSRKLVGDIFFYFSGVCSVHFSQRADVAVAVFFLS